MSRQCMYRDEARIYTRIGAARAVEPIDITRPERVLQSASSRYPGIWPCLESVRRHPWESCGFRGWQPWCYMPVDVVAGAKGHLHRDRYSQDMVDVLLSGETRLASALAAWRMTKGVYKFDPTVLEAMMGSDVKDDLPEEALLRLPDWCVHIPTPGVDFSDGLPMHGFCAYVDDHGVGGTGHPPELNFEILIDPKAASPSMLMSLVATTPPLIVEVSYAMREGDPVAVAREWLPRDREFLHVHQDVDLTGGSFGASFTRLAEEAEIKPDGYGSRRCAVRDQEGRAKRTYATSSLESWKVGYRIGLSLRAAERHLQTAADAPRGDGRSPRAHMRRAQWHTFLTGPRTGTQSRRVKWLPPIPVGIASPDALVPSVHRVVDRLAPAPRSSPETGRP